MSWSIRLAGADDLDAIMAIERSVFEADAWSRETMAAELGGRHGHYLVATPPDEPKQIAAYAGLRSPASEAQADIQTIAVAESARRRGLGRALMIALLGVARARGANEVFLEVRADNPGAQCLYRSLGFQEIALRVRYYQPGNVDAVVMRCRLSPSERVAS